MLKIVLRVDGLVQDSEQCQMYKLTEAKVIEPVSTRVTVKF